MAKNETFNTDGNGGATDGDDAQKAASRFEEWKAQAREHYKGLDLKALVQAQADGKAQKENLTAQLAKCNAFYDVLRYELVPGTMDDMGITTIKYEEIGRVALTPDLLVSTKPGQQGGLFGWLKQHKLGDIIKPSVNASTLKAFVKGRMKAGKEYPNEFLNITPVTRASITAVK